MLYFVATPIGNLKDITIRAIETLQSVDIIACEDTRNSLKLLLHYDIKKPLIAYHKFNEKNSSEGIIKLLQEGKKVAVISDAGMPLISDPGYILVQKLKEKNLPYTVVAGANAGLSALILSGLDTTFFTFVGFLPDDNKSRNKLLKKLTTYESTLIFYISPYSLQKDIKDLNLYLGKRKASLVKEISKIHEAVVDFELGSDLSIDIKGEYVLVVEKAAQCESDLCKLSVEEHLKHYLDSGVIKQDAIKKVAKDRNIPKNEVYKTTF